MANIARGNANPDLQKKAIRNLAINNSPENGKLLAEVYASSNDIEIRREILRSYIISGDHEHAAAAARGEKSPELRSEAIKVLGVMGDQKTLAELYASESDRHVKEQILNGLFVGGAVDKLIEVARNEKDPELKKKAINNLGLVGGEKSGEALTEMYRSSSDEGVKGAVLQAFFLQGNAKELLEAAKSEKNPELQKKAINNLGLIGVTKSGDALVSMYGSASDEGVKKAILNAFFLQNNCKAVVDIARKESNIELKKTAVQKLSIMQRCKEGTDYLMELLNK
jgi:hypothetical protein